MKKAGTHTHTHTHTYTHTHTLPNTHTLAMTIKCTHAPPRQVMRCSYPEAKIHDEESRHNGPKGSPSFQGDDSLRAEHIKLCQSCHSSAGALCALITSHDKLDRRHKHTRLMHTRAHTHTHTHTHTRTLIHTHTHTHTHTQHTHSTHTHKHKLTGLPTAASAGLGSGEDEEVAHTQLDVIATLQPSLLEKITEVR